MRMESRPRKHDRLRGGTLVHSSLRLVGACSFILLDTIGLKKEVMAPIAWCFAWLGRACRVGCTGLTQGGIARDRQFINTLATAVASFTWAMLKYACAANRACSGFVRRGRRLVHPPAGGYVDPTGAIILGVAAGIVPFLPAQNEIWLGYETRSILLASTLAERSEHYHWCARQLRV